MGQTTGRRSVDRVGETTTVIGPNTHIVGQISGKGHFLVCGAIDGDCDVEGLVTLARGAHWQGVLRATDIIVAGDVEGEVVAASKLEVAATATIRGQVCGKIIAIAEGAVIKGEMMMSANPEIVRFTEKRRGEPR